MATTLRNLDLNLLRVFDVLWTERSVSVAARRLSRTQSAVSLALERLRQAFDDPLFRWSGRAMQPTARAEQLAPRIRAIIKQVHETLESGVDEPRLAQRDFTIATADYIDWLLGGQLMRRLEDEAPNLTLFFVDVNPRMLERRRAAEMEFFIVPSGAIDAAALRSAPLFRDRYVCVAARDNAEVHEGMDFEHFRRLPQVGYTIEPKRQYSHETLHLDALNVRYRNRVLTPHYMAIPLIVAETRGVAVMQERLARFMAERVPLKLVTPPIAYPDLELELYWHPQYDDDATHRWLRETVVEVAAKLPPLPARSAPRKPRAAPSRRRGAGGRGRAR